MDSMTQNRRWNTYPPDFALRNAHGFDEVAGHYRLARPIAPADLLPAGSPRQPTYRSRAGGLRVWQPWERPKDRRWYVGRRRRAMALSGSSARRDRRDVAIAIGVMLAVTVASAIYAVQTFGGIW